MKYLVIGSHGVIGKNFSKYVEKLGHTVLPWDIKMGSQYDLRKENTLLLEEINKADYVLFAAYDIGGFKYLSNIKTEFINNNMLIMINTFPLLKEKKFIFLSSQMVTLPHNEYGTLKKLGEHYTNKLHGVNVRLWNVYDIEPIDEKSHVICDFIKKAKTGKIDILSNGEEVRQFLHATDCSKALYNIFQNYDKQDIKSQQHIDLSCFNWISIKEIANIISSFIPCEISLGTQADYQIKNEPDKFILKYFTPEIDIKTGIKNVIDQFDQDTSSDEINYIPQLINTTINGKGDSDKHLITLFSLVLQLNAKNILELGVRKGVTTLPLLAASKITGGSVVSVDIDSTEFLCPNELKSRWTFIQSDAIQFLQQNTTIWDLVYIDDWHSYDHVKKELELLDSKITPSTIIVLHDLMYANYEPHYHTDLDCHTGQWANGGPYRAVCELNKNFWEFSTIPVCNGLTILRKKYTSLYNKK